MFSMTSNRPTYGHALLSRRPLLGAPTVNVKDAFIAMGSGCPFNPFKPEGISMETTFRPAAFTSCITSHHGDLSGRFKPMPNNASTTKPGLEERFLRSAAIDLEGSVMFRRDTFLSGI